MSDGSPNIAVTLRGLELALVPPALTTFLYVPFGLTTKTPLPVEDYERLQALSTRVTDAVTELFAQISARATGTTRSEIIALRKEAVLTLEMRRSDLALVCVALRDVCLEYRNEPKGINVYFGGDEYGATVEDLIAVSERLRALQD